VPHAKQILPPGETIINPIYHFSTLPFETAVPYSDFMKHENTISEVAEILAEGILRLHLRNVRKRPNSLPSPESLEVSDDKSLHRLELEPRGEER